MKYRALTDGLECCEVMYSSLNAEHRIDAEYFSREHVSLYQAVKSRPNIILGDIADVTDGIHASFEYDENSNINMISATSPRDNYFDLSREAIISEQLHRDNPRTALKAGDVILSSVGTIGNCAVVTDDILPANSSRSVGIIRLKSSLLPNVLACFLLSKYGRNQSDREKTGNVQPCLFIYKIKEVSPNTRPIILFEEPLLNRFGSEKRGNEDIDSETLVSIYSRIFEKLHANSAYVGVQCLKKCDWQMPIDAGVDLISFNAYTNPHNLHIIAPKLWSFLQNGGYINWGIVPADGVDSVKGTNCETVLNDYNEILNSFIIRGFEEDVISKKSLVSPQNDVSKLPMIFADTALLNAYNLSSAIENQQQ